MHPLHGAFPIRLTWRKTSRLKAASKAVFSVEGGAASSHPAQLDNFDADRDLQRQRR
jgi:hypothetical protein